MNSIHGISASWINEHKYGYYFIKSNKECKYGFHYNQHVYLVPFTMIQPFRLAIGHDMQMIGKFIQRRYTYKSNNSFQIHN
jgi:hypothetical protein